jgi:hypothetical protein
MFDREKGLAFEKLKTFCARVPDILGRHECTTDVTVKAGRAGRTHSGQ